MSTATDRHPHIALFPSAGMGHLTPFLRLAPMLTSGNCHVTLITGKPTVSAAESTHITTFLAAYPTVNRHNFQILSYTPPVTGDPFFVQFQAIIRSAHLFAPLLSSSLPPISTIFADCVTAAGICQVADDLDIPNYIVTTTSARFFSLMVYIPLLIPPGSSIAMAEASVEIPGLAPFEISTLPPPFFIPDHIFTNTLISNFKLLSRAKGILSNTFRAFEPETIATPNGGKVIPDFPPFSPDRNDQPLPWLDQQSPESVVYVSFGSRTAMSRDQITELRNGLDGNSCGY